MASPIPEPTPTTGSAEDDHLPALPEPVTENAKDIAGEVRFTQGTQPRWFKYWPYVLIVWALWYAFIGGQGVFHVEQPVNLFFSGVVIAWAVYHLLAPRFNWPNLPLG